MQKKRWANSLTLENLSAVVYSPVVDSAVVDLVTVPANLVSCSEHLTRPEIEKARYEREKRIEWTQAGSNR